MWSAAKGKRVTSGVTKSLTVYDVSQPSVQIEFLSAADAFAIDELTFVAMLAPTADRDDGGVATLWLELLVRRTDDSDGERVIPELRLRFPSPLHGSDEPSCAVQASLVAPGVSLDMNRLMHADIWYSFVKVGLDDTEFMEAGYVEPTRILYDCVACEVDSTTRSHNGPDELHVSEEPWIGIDAAQFTDPLARTSARHVSDAARRFNTDLIHFHSRFPERWQSETYAVREVRRAVVVPRDTRQFAAVRFDPFSVRPPYRYAVRRLPWTERESRHASPPWSVPGSTEPPFYGVSYGGTAIIVRDGRDYTLVPHAFDMASGKMLRANLAVGEGLRFWVRWRSKEALGIDEGWDKFTASYRLDVRARLASVNAFFHTPTEFEYVPGSPTELRPFSLARPLFFLWRSPRAQANYSYSQRLDGAGTAVLDFVAQFRDRTRERRRVIDTFILGQLLTVLMTASMTLALQGATHRSRLTGEWFDLPMGRVFWLFELRMGALIAAVFVAAAMWRAYAGRTVRWVPLLALLLCVLALPDSLVTSQFTIVAWAIACVLLADEALFVGLRQRVMRRARARSRFRLWRERREYLRDLAHFYSSANVQSSL